MRIQAPSLGISPTFFKETLSFVGNTLFLAYYIKKDAGRLKNMEEDSFWDKKQKVVVVSGKVLGDILRLSDVVCDFFPHLVQKRYQLAAKQVGLFLGGVDAVNQRLSLMKKISIEGVKTSSCLSVLSNVYFAGYSFGSIQHPSAKFQGYSQPKHMLGLMITAIVASIFAKKFEKSTAK